MSRKSIRSQPSSGLTQTCKRCQKQFSYCGQQHCASSEPNDRGAFCQACFLDCLRQVERRALGNYSSFGILARETAVNVFAEQFAKSTDPTRRKLHALKVFEEMMLAAEDPCILCYAPRNHRERPVLDAMLNFELHPKVAQAWRDELCNMFVSLTTTLSRDRRQPFPVPLHDC